MLFFALFYTFCDLKVYKKLFLHQKIDIDQRMACGAPVRWMKCTTSWFGVCFLAVSVLSTFLNFHWNRATFDENKNGMEICRAKKIHLIANNNIKMPNCTDTSWTVDNIKAKDIRRAITKGTLITLKDFFRVFNRGLFLF